MNNIDTKTINRSIKGQGLVFVFCALFCLIGLLCIPRIKVFAEADNGGQDGVVADAVYDWAAFVPDADKIKSNPSLKAYCLANKIDYKDFTSDDALKDSDSDTVDRSNGRFVGRKSCILMCTDAAVAWGRHSSVISYVRDRRRQL